MVAPADYTFRQRGRKRAELGSIFTLAMQKTDGRWRVTGWAWAKH